MVLTMGGKGRVRNDSAFLGIKHLPSKNINSDNEEYRAVEKA
jgi:hypothetical protein